MDERIRIGNYRGRAEEIRVLAETMKVGEVRAAMLAIAADYLHMAEQLEKRLPDGDQPRRIV